MKNIFLILILLFISSSLYSQDYRISQKAMAEKSKDLRYEFSVSYPQIKDFKDNISGMNMFNKLIEGKWKN